MGGPRGLPLRCRGADIGCLAHGTLPGNREQCAFRACCFSNARGMPSFLRFARPMQQLNALHSKYPFVSNQTRSILMNTYIKFYNMYDVCLLSVLQDLVHGDAACEAWSWGCNVALSSAVLFALLWLESFAPKVHLLCVFFFHSVSSPANCLGSLASLFVLS